MLGDSVIYQARGDVLCHKHESVHCVNHLERRLGALYAKLCGAGRATIDLMGLWSSNTVVRFYDKLIPPDDVARLAGHGSQASYCLDRDRASIREFITTHPGSEAMFGVLFPDVFDDDVWDATRRMSERSDSSSRDPHSTPLQCLKAFDFVTRVLFQDLPLLRRDFPDLRIFRSGPLVKHGSHFEAWCSFVFDRIRSPPPTPSLGDVRIERLEVQVQATTDFLA